MKSRIFQRTWYGDDCERRMIEWISNLEKCFTLLSVKFKTYWQPRGKWSPEKRCKLIVRYR